MTQAAQASQLPAQKAGYGTVAVDPRVIPLAQRFISPATAQRLPQIPAVQLRSNRVDVCYNSKSEAYGWGVRNATVYVLK